MITTIFSTADEFLNKTLTFLEKNEAANSLMLGIAMRLKRFPGRIQRAPYLALVEDEQGIVAAALMTPPFNLVLYSERQDFGSALEVIARDLITRNQDVSGVIGPTHIPEAFAKTWSNVSGKRFKLNRRERLFELRQVNSVPYCSGTLRTANAVDADLVTRWAIEFQKEALGDANIAEIPEMIQRRISDGDIYLWEDSKPVSMAARTRPTTNGISVGLVYTPPDLRRRGYATSLVAKLSRSLLDAGWKFCALFTDLANPTSNHIYEQIGYKPVCDFNEYLFE